MYLMFLESLKQSPSSTTGQLTSFNIKPQNKERKTVCTETNTCSDEFFILSLAVWIFLYVTESSVALLVDIRLVEPASEYFISICLPWFVGFEGRYCFF